MLRIGRHIVTFSTELFISYHEFFPVLFGVVVLEVSLHARTSQQVFLPKPWVQLHSYTRR